MISTYFTLNTTVSSSYEYNFYDILTAHAVNKEEKKIKKKISHVHEPRQFPLSPRTIRQPEPDDPGPETCRKHERKKIESLATCACQGGGDGGERRRGEGRGGGRGTRGVWTQ